jgi:hypothetical protein
MPKFYPMYEDVTEEGVEDDEGEGGGVNIMGSAMGGEHTCPRDDSEASEGQNTSSLGLIDVTSLCHSGMVSVCFILVDDYTLNLVFSIFHEITNVRKIFHESLSRSLGQLECL